jgi:tryptophan-rich sensory protein
MKPKIILTFLIAIIIPQIAGAIGSIFSFSSIPTWYTTLVRPSIAPPNWVFGPVWTTLFLLMGISSFIIYQKGINRPDVRRALYVFFIQLILNATWSILFFGLNDIGAALIEIVGLWVIILANIILFWRISKIAGYILIPYILWVSFASYLNYTFFILNN